MPFPSLYRALRPLALATLLFAGAAPLPAATWVVATDGDDGNPGTAAEPFATFAHASSLLAPGDTLLIRGGTYSEHLFVTVAASPADPVVVQAWPGESPVIDGSGFSDDDQWTGLVSVQNSSGIKVEGLAVQHAPGMGFQAQNSSFVTFLGNSSYDTWSSGVGAWHSEEVSILDNEVELACNDGSQECITVASCSLFVVSGNHVFNSGPGTNGGEGIDAKHSQNGEVTGNLVHDIHRLGIYVDAWDAHTHSIRVEGNTVYRCDGAGIALSSEMGGLLEDIVVANNVAWHNTIWGLVVAHWPDEDNSEGLVPMADLEVVHNTFVLNGVHPDSGARWGGGISIENDQVDTLVIRNNLVAWGSAFQIEGEAIDGLHDEIGLQLDHNLVWGELGYYMEIGDQGAGSLAADPLLADTAARDFSLTASSPAVDAGLVHPGIEEDYEGDLRFIGEGVDIGADELDYTSAPERLPAALRPDQPRLAPAWPNPFNGRVSLRIQLPTSSSVELAVYDLQGRLVALLEDGRLAEGEHRFHWQPDDAASGTYLVRLRSGPRTQTRKVVLLR